MAVALGTVCSKQALLMGVAAAVLTKTEFGLATSEANTKTTNKEENSCRAAAQQTSSFLFPPTHPPFVF